MFIESPVHSVLFTLFSQLKEQKASLSPELDATLSQLSELASDRGIELFDLERYRRATPYLIIAAALGDVLSQFTLATYQSRLDGGFKTPSNATARWLKLAAEQDYVPALIRLNDTEAHAKALALSTVGADAGFSDPMLHLYQLTNDTAWLEKAAATNDSVAYYELACLYQREPQHIPNATERAARIEELMQASATGGYYKALHSRIFDEKSPAGIAEKQQRLLQLIWRGSLDALLAYGYALIGVAQNGGRVPLTYGLEKDVSKGHAVMKFVYNRVGEELPLEVFSRLKKDLSGLQHQVEVSTYGGNDPFMLELQARIPTIYKSGDRIEMLGGPY